MFRMFRLQGRVRVDTKSLEAFSRRQGRTAQEDQTILAGHRHSDEISRLTMATRFDPDSDNLPKLDELQPIEGAPRYASWFWGLDDEVRPTLSCLFIGSSGAIPALTL